MPPKEKIGKQELLEAGLAIIRKNGFENVNARSIAKELSCSTHPIFRVYKDMGDFKAALFDFAVDYCNEYMGSVMTAYPNRRAFAIGMSYIDFAAKESNLFKFLFMSNQFKRNQAEQIWKSEENAPVIHEMALGAGISFEQGQSLFQRLWLFTHGIASLAATNGEFFTADETAQILTEAFTGFLNQIKSKGANQ